MSFLPIRFQLTKMVLFVPENGFLTTKHTIGKNKMTVKEQILQFINKAETNNPFNIVIYSGKEYMEKWLKGYEICVQAYKYINWKQVALDWVEEDEDKYVGEEYRQGWILRKTNEGFDYLCTCDINEIHNLKQLTADDIYFVSYRIQEESDDEEKYDIETTIVTGIVCNTCHNELPPMTMKQHLDGDFNQECPHTM